MSAPDDYMANGLAELRTCLAAAHAETLQGIEWARAIRGVDKEVEKLLVAARANLRGAIQLLPGKVDNAEM